MLEYDNVNEKNRVWKPNMFGGGYETSTKWQMSTKPTQYMTPPPPHSVVALENTVTFNLKKERAEKPAVLWPTLIIWVVMDASSGRRPLCPTSTGSSGFSQGLSDLSAPDFL